jgi:hypothetical protein
LIRSPRGPEATEEPDYNLDLMLLGVRYVGSRMLFRGIHLYESTLGEANALAMRAGIDLEETDRLFVFESEGRRDFAIAAHVAVLRTTSGIFESSLVMQWSPLEGESDRYREAYLADYAQLRRA